MTIGCVWSLPVPNDAAVGEASSDGAASARTFGHKKHGFGGGFGGGLHGGG